MLPYLLWPLDNCEVWNGICVGISSWWQKMHPLYIYGLEMQRVNIFWIK